MGIRSLISSKYISSRRGDIDRSNTFTGINVYPLSQGGPFLLDYSQGTFTRTSEASFVDPRNSWQFAMTGWGTNQSFYHLTNDNSFDDASWTSTFSAVTASVAISPGGGNADEIGDWNATQFGLIRRTINSSGSYGKFSVDIFVKKDSDTSRFPEFGLDGPTDNFRVQLNTFTGEIVTRTTGVTFPEKYALTSSTVSDAGSWWKLNLNRISNGGVFVYVYPSVTNIFGSNTVTTTGSIIIGDITIKEELHDAWKTANKPRIFDDGAILIEGARTNYVYPSELFSGGVWNPGSSDLITNDYAIAPDGLLSADRHNLSPNGYSPYYGMGVGGAPVSFSLYAKPSNNISSSCVVAIQSGSLTSNPAGTFNQIISGASYIRVSLSESKGSFAVPQDSRAQYYNTTTGSRDVVLWGAQVESSSNGGINFPSSYIRTQTAATTRTAETLYIDNAPSYLYSTGYSVDVYPEFSSAESNDFHYVFHLNALGSTYLLFAKLGNQMRVYHGNNSILTICPEFSFNRGDRITIKVEYGKKLMVYVNGVLVSSSADADLCGSWAQFIGTRLYVGSSYASQYHFHGVISRPTRL